MGRSLKRYFPIFVLPLLLAFTVSFLIPFAAGVILSFTEFTTVTDARFVGFANYVEAFSQNGNFLGALLFTIAVTAVCVLIVNVAAFALALILFSGIREKLETCDIPKCFRGMPIALIAASITALSFAGFAGLFGI